MDIGFGSLIEKFEQYVGQRATRLLIHVIFVAVFAFSANAIFANLITPLAKFFDTPLWGSTLIQIFLMMLATAMGVAVGVQVIASFRSWSHAKKGRALVEESKAVRAQVVKLREEIEADLRQVRDLADKAGGLHQANGENARLLMNLFESMMERDASTEEERAVIVRTINQLRAALDEIDGIDAKAENEGNAIAPKKKAPPKRGP